jgi:hypothetical protein
MAIGRIAISFLLLLNGYTTVAKSVSDTTERLLASKWAIVEGEENKP